MNYLLIIITLLSMVFTNCNKATTKEEDDSASKVEIENLKEGLPDKSYNLSNDWISDIDLNNETKWEANVESTQGVQAMLDLIKKSNLNTIEDYHSLGTKLNEEKNMIIKKCTMTGPSHDNLHVFLLPLVEKIDFLLAVTSTEEASKITTSIVENLNAYKNYFD